MRPDPLLSLYSGHAQIFLDKLWFTTSLMHMWQHKHIRTVCISDNTCRAKTEKKNNKHRNQKQAYLPYFRSSIESRSCVPKFVTLGQKLSLSHWCIAFPCRWLSASAGSGFRMASTGKDHGVKRRRTRDADSKDMHQLSTLREIRINLCMRKKSRGKLPAEQLVAWSHACACIMCN
jgi:hypothetical protein